MMRIGVLWLRSMFSSLLLHLPLFCGPLSVVSSGILHPALDGADLSLRTLALIMIAANRSICSVAF